MIDVKPEAYPSKQIKVVCTDCNTTLATVEWSNYAEYQRKKANLKKWYTVCEKCTPKAEGSKPVWVKQEDGNWIAKCKNGDFLIWQYEKKSKSRNPYKWRYRRYNGEVEIDDFGCAESPQEAKDMITKHPEWIAKGAE